MIGHRKEYDPVLGDFAEAGERAVKAWLSASGYVLTEHPHGKLGVDLEAENDAERFYVEVERAQERRWKEGRFPSHWPTYHVLERRSRYKHQAILVAVSCELSDAIATFSQSWTKDRLKSNPNRLCRDGTELVFDVPTVELLPLNLSVPIESFARLNQQRWKELTSTHPLLCKEYLGTPAPYGVNQQQWTEWCASGESQFRPAVAANCHHSLADRDIRPDAYGRAGYKTHYCKRCGRFYGHGRIQES